MRYVLVEGDDGVIWQDEDASGFVQLGSPQWDAYLSWLALGNRPEPNIGKARAVTLAEAEDCARERLYAAVEAALAPILSQYPAAEVASWPLQLDQARAWLADPTVPTPLLDGLVGTRDKHALCQSIIAKAMAYQSASGRVFAWRHACSAWIEACSDAMALVDWNPNFPEVPA